MSVIRRIYHSPSALVGSIIVAFYCLLAIFPGVVAPFSPLAQHPTDRLEPPSVTYRLGTDEFGRDLLSRIIYGARNSMGIAISSVAIAVFLGTMLGMVAGYVGGVTDNVIMRVMDMFFAFPALLLALFVVSALGPGAANTVLAIALVYTPIFARTARGPVLSLKEREFVQAAVLIGARHSRILARHILPNLLPPVLTTATLALSWAVLTEAGLSFLGLGTVPPNPSWGSMLNDARTLMQLAPWTAIFPGLAILLSVLGFNFLGDGLRDILDPRLRV